MIDNLWFRCLFFDTNCILQRMFFWGLSFKFNFSFKSPLFSLATLLITWCWNFTVVRNWFDWIIRLFKLWVIRCLNNFYCLYRRLLNVIVALLVTVLENNIAVRGSVRTHIKIILKVLTIKSTRLLLRCKSPCFIIHLNLRCLMINLLSMNTEIFGSWWILLIWFIWSQISWAHFKWVFIICILDLSFLGMSCFNLIYMIIYGNLISIWRVFWIGQISNLSCGQSITGNGGHRHK